MFSTEKYARLKSFKQ